MYEDLAARTVATANIFAMAASTSGQRKAGGENGGQRRGVYLNASMAESGVIVHMRLDKTMTAILVKIDPKFAKLVTEDGSSYP